MGACLSSAIRRLSFLAVLLCLWPFAARAHTRTPFSFVPPQAQKPVFSSRLEKDGSRQESPSLLVSLHIRRDGRIGIICGGDPLNAFSMDDLLTNISIYWLTGTISSSIRFYKEMRADPLRFDARITPPFAFAQFPVEIPCPPREVAERHLNVKQWTVMPRGGHFAAMEQPALLAADIKAFFRDHVPA